MNTISITYQEKQLPFEMYYPRHIRNRIQETGFPVAHTYTGFEYFWWIKKQKHHIKREKEISKVK